MKKRRTEQYRATQSNQAYLYANRPFKWFLDLIRPVRGRFLFAQLLDLAFVATSVIPATITGLLVDDVLTNRRLELLPRYLLLLVLIPLVRSCVAVVFRFQFESCSQNTVMRIRESLYRHLQNLDASFYNRSRIGDIMSKMTGDVDMVRHFIAFTAFATLDNVVLFVFGSLYIFTVSWKLALVALLISPAIFILTYRLGRTVRPIWSEIREAFSRLNSVVQQNIAGNRVVRAFARADFEEEKFEKQNVSYRDANMRHNKAAVRFLPALDGLANLLTVPVILVGGILVIRGQLTIGGLVTFNGLLFVLTQPMRMAGNLMNEIQRYSASAAKVIDLFIERPRILQPQDQAGEATAEDELFEQKRQADIRGKVEFRDVTFTYGERKGHALQPSLKNINLVAEPGQTIGIVGLTGSGKTSLVNLIPRLYDTTFGAILIDDIDVRDYNLQELRRNIGMVMQDVFLFSDTIEGNIAYGVPEIDQDAVLTAARTAAADGFIRKMSEGYDTIIGERGVGLSGGQRQRIALARALIIRPRILILDDTTSAVDMETEQEIQQALARDLKGSTVFIIAHRISSVRNADQIIVLDEGSMVERGTHEELLALRGIYFDVFATQAGLTAEEAAALGLEGGAANGTQPL
ncbi:MAG: ABC transporter ATP-binding protein [Clostridiaceae bacterium]|nr:ABC transporter ATP-binding protein [Clostridiaceae bacterium]